MEAIIFGKMFPLSKTIEANISDDGGAIDKGFQKYQILKCQYTFLYEVVVSVWGPLWEK